MNSFPQAFNLLASMLNLTRIVYCFLHFPLSLLRTWKRRLVPTTTWNMTHSQKEKNPNTKKAKMNIYGIDQFPINLQANMNIYGSDQFSINLLPLEQSRIIPRSGRVMALYTIQNLTQTPSTIAQEGGTMWNDVSLFRNS